MNINVYKMYEVKSYSYYLTNNEKNCFDECCQKIDGYSLLFLIADNLKRIINTGVQIHNNMIEISQNWENSKETYMVIEFKEVI